MGFGTGILSIVSLLLGAKKVTAVDIDEDSLAIARLNSENLNIEYVCCDISDFNCSDSCDVVIQNPPFGSQKKSERGADLKFIDKARECSPGVIYSFHMASTEKFMLLIFSDTNLFYLKFMISTPKNQKKWMLLSYVQKIFS